MSANAKVFNWRFYLYTNPDLIRYGLVTEQQAVSHWLNNGIYEGRQAHPAFHALQYIQKYPDLLGAFGYNYVASTNHYINNGIAEGRVGHATNTHGDPMGTYRRITLTSKHTGDVDSWHNPLTVSMSRQFAGAIDSICYKDFEFINSYDHGRQAQFAWQYGSSPSGTATQPTFDALYAELFNPTEAGNERDAVGLNSSSSINTLSFSHPNVLDIKTRFAYWRQPHESQGQYTSVNSNDTMRKVVVVSPMSIPRLTRISAFVTPEASNPKKAIPTRYEAPALYINPELNTFWEANGSLTSLTQIPNQKQSKFSNTFMWEGNPAGGWYGAQGGEVPNVVIASGNGKAIGCLVRPSSSFTRISYQIYFQNHQVATTTPANRTRSMGAAVYVTDGSKYIEFTSYIAVGDTPQQVLATLKLALETNP